MAYATARQQPSSPGATTCPRSGAAVKRGAHTSRPSPHLTQRECHLSSQHNSSLAVQHQWTGFHFTCTAKGGWDALILTHCAFQIHFNLVHSLKASDFESDGQRISIKQKEDWLTRKKPQVLRCIIHRDSFAHFRYLKCLIKHSTASEARVGFTHVPACYMLKADSWMHHSTAPGNSEVLWTNSKDHFLHFGTISHWHVLWE